MCVKQVFWKAYDYMYQDMRLMYVSRYVMGVLL